MRCSWCYQLITATDRHILDRHGSTVHLDCAYTEVGMGVERTDREYQLWLGMTGDELE